MITIILLLGDTGQKKAFTPYPIFYHFLKADSKAGQARKLLEVRIENEFFVCPCNIDNCLSA
jgi:hypothetical protein